MAKSIETSEAVEDASPSSDRKSTYRFLNKAGLADLLEQKGLPGFIDAELIFRSKTQRTWIAVTPKFVVCILDSASTAERDKQVQWRTPLLPIPRIVVRNHERFSRLGRVDIGGRQNWLYTRSLYGQQEELKLALSRLINRAAYG